MDNGELKLENEWKEVKLGDLVEVNKSSISQTDKYDYINYLDTGNITENKIDEIKKLILGKDKFPSRAKRKVEKDDIIISTVRPNQKHYGIINGKIENLIVSTGFAVLNAKKELAVPYYLYSYLTLNNVIEYLSAIAETSTSTYPSIKPSVIEELKINLPPLPTQKKIAEILSSLDDKIELNNQMNKTLEEMAQAIFKQWFVDFEFPNENGEPYKSSGGEMVESELGLIPKGWRVGKLGEIISVQNGYAFKSRDFQEIGNIGIIKIKNISSNKVDIENMDFITEQIAEKVDNKFKITSGAILIAMTGAEVGKVGIVAKTNKKLFLNQRVGMFRDKMKGGTKYSYIMIVSNEWQEYIRGKAMGSAQPNISANGIEEIKIIIPAINILEKFDKIISENLELITENLYQIGELTQIRDTLLPKLMNGEIDVNEV